MGLEARCPDQVGSGRVTPLSTPPLTGGISSGAQDHPVSSFLETLRLLKAAVLTLLSPNLVTMFSC